MIGLRGDRVDEMTLEAAEQVCEGSQLDKLLAGRRVFDDLVLKDPGEVVGQEDRVQAGSQSGVDVGTRRVADHPRVRRIAGVASNEFAVCFLLLLGEHFHCREVFAKS